MNIRKYEAFVKAVELGSLSKAAEQLGYTQSGISHMMQSLEDEVGFPLMVNLYFLSVLSSFISFAIPIPVGSLNAPTLRV